MSFTARRFLAICEHMRTVPLTRYEQTEFDRRARELADYLIGRFA